MKQIILLILSLFSLCVYAGNEIRDEWETIDKLIISTDVERKILRPYAKEIIKIAVKNGVRIVIIDDDEKSQKTILNNLKNEGVIDDKKDSYIQFTESKHNTGFARDEAPIVVFDKETGAASMTSTEFANPKDSKEILEDVSKKVGLKNVGLVNLKIEGFDPLGLALDGGNLLTTDNGKTLITTSDFYKNMGISGENKKKLDEALKEPLGITKVIELAPLDEKSKNYNLSNVHVDLQVRTLPGGKIIVASTPKGDDQHDILNKNAEKLKNEGYDVVRIMNAPQDNNKLFKTYTNALFVNGTIIVPSYGDKEKDDLAKKSYDQALNMNIKAGEKKNFKIVLIDANDVIKNCGAARCIAREIPRLPSAKKAKEVGSKTPTLSFDSDTGVLSFTQDIITFVGSPDETVGVSFVDDFILGSTIDIGDMFFNAGMSQDDRFVFTDGSVSIYKDGVELLKSTIPVFTIYGQTPDDALNSWGILNDIVIASEGTSEWLDAFKNEVLSDLSLLPDFYIDSPIDLIEHSNGFSNSFFDVQLNKVGVVGNGSPVSVAEPATWVLFLFSIPLINYCLKHGRVSKKSCG